MPGGLLLLRGTVAVVGRCGTGGRLGGVLLGHHRRVHLEHRPQGRNPPGVSGGHGLGPLLLELAADLLVAVALGELHADGLSHEIDRQGGQMTGQAVTARHTGCPRAPGERASRAAVLRPDRSGGPARVRAVWSGAGRGGGSRGNLGGRRIVRRGGGSLGGQFVEPVGVNVDCPFLPGGVLGEPGARCALPGLECVRRVDRQHVAACGVVGAAGAGRRADLRHALGPVPADRGHRASSCIEWCRMSCRSFR